MSTSNKCIINVRQKRKYVSDGVYSMVIEKEV